ncbi:uncharacterized protein LOC131159200 isoform X2 [Malania oleifera]|uniref:uncharacterized protein LOC131159200 isoform X2 n=1 Tax=Malania oleifera TaxID=397392 RepID=UPI0025AE5894|nr:uncharacterized protein LOC131159200 isoform X2 [Malania oleifera]
MELQILEAGLRDFEPDPEQEPSLAQLLWCERNLKNSLQRIMSKKELLVGSSQPAHGQSTFQVGMEENGGTAFSHNFNGKEQNSCARNILMQLDPWISPYSSKVREKILQNLCKGTKEILPVNNQVLGSSCDSSYKFPVSDFPSNSTMEPQLPSYTAVQTMGTSHTLPIVLNQPLGMSNSTSFEMVGHNQPSMAEQFPTQTRSFEYYGKSNQGSKDNASQMFQYCNSKPMEVDWFNGANQDTCQNLNAFVQRVSSPPPYEEPLLSTTPITGNNKTDGTQMTNETLPPVLVQADTPMEFSRDSHIPNDPSVVGATGNERLWTEGRQEGSYPWEWEGSDGFFLPENLNLEDLDFPF